MTVAMRSTTKRNLFVALVGTFTLAVIVFRYGGGRPRVSKTSVDRNHQHMRHLATKRPTGKIDGNQVRLHGIADERGAGDWDGGREEIEIVPRRRSKGRDWLSEEKKKMAFQKYPAAKTAPVGHGQTALNIIGGKTGGKLSLVKSFNKLKPFSDRQTELFFKRVDGDTPHGNSARVGKLTVNNAVDDVTVKRNDIVPIRYGIRPTKSSFGVNKRFTTPAHGQPRREDTDRSRGSEQKKTINAIPQRPVNQQKNVKAQPISRRVDQTRGTDPAADGLQSQNVYPYKTHPTTNVPIRTHATDNTIVRSQFKDDTPDAKQPFVNQKFGVASTLRNTRTRDAGKAKLGVLSQSKTPDVKQPIANQKLGVSSMEDNARTRDANKAIVGFKSQGEAPGAKQTFVNQRIGNPVTNRKTRIRGTGETAGDAQSLTDNAGGEQPLVNRQIVKERASLTYATNKETHGFQSPKKQTDSSHDGKQPPVGRPIETDRASLTYATNEETHGFQSPRKYPDGKQLVATKQIVSTTNDRNSRIGSTEKATDRPLSLSKHPDKTREVIRDRKPKWPTLHN